MKHFNTSGPNIPERHYTIFRNNLIAKGEALVQQERYFTIWAPRQTGKSTFFLQLADKLVEQDYKIAQVNFENFRNASLPTFLYELSKHIHSGWGLDLNTETELAGFFSRISENTTDRCVLIIDEVEGINPEYFGDFLHSISNLYHSSHKHCLKSVILVGVSNIVGIVHDHASPFNITENLRVPYFTNQEVQALLHQHEKETGQLFEKKVLRKIQEITANQPGLVNGFAYQLVERTVGKRKITYSDYLAVEDWYLTEAIDKNFANILNKANEYRSFVEHLLFTEELVPFDIDRPSIKLLHTNGLLCKSKDGYVQFWVPFYKKRLFKAFYPYTNGEQRYISQSIFADEYFTTDGRLLLDKLIEHYKEYVKRRGFAVFRAKDENGNYMSIKEAALIYSFETYIHAFITQTDGKIYREANTGLGKSDIILNVRNREYLIETKIYYAPKQFTDGKKQLAYYCKSLGQTEGIYLVYCPSHISYPEWLTEDTVVVDGISITTFLVVYDDRKWD